MAESHTTTRGANKVGAATPLSETVLYDLPEPAIARITMNRPQARNA